MHCYAFVMLYLKDGPLRSSNYFQLLIIIGSRVTNYDWPFWTLPFGLFGSNLDTRDLETYARTYSGHF